MKKSKSLTAFLKNHDRIEHPPGPPQSSSKVVYRRKPGAEVRRNPWRLIALHASITAVNLLIIFAF